MGEKVLQKFQSTGTHFFSFIIHHGKYFPLSNRFCPATLCFAKFLISFRYYFFIASTSLESPHLLNRDLCWTMLLSLKPHWSERYLTNEHRQQVHALTSVSCRAKSELDLSCCWLCSSTPCLDHASLCCWLWNSLFSSLYCATKPSSSQNTSPPQLWKPLGKGKQSHSPSYMGQLRSMEEKLLVHNQPGDQQQSQGKKMGFINTEPLSI